MYLFPLCNHSHQGPTVGDTEHDKDNVSPNNTVAGESVELKIGLPNRKGINGKKKMK